MPNEVIIVWISYIPTREFDNINEMMTKLNNYR